MSFLEILKKLFTKIYSPLNALNLGFQIAWRRPSLFQDLDRQPKIMKYDVDQTRSVSECSDYLLDGLLLKAI